MSLPDLRRDAAIFTRSATAFFRDLEQDNSREFFTAHRDRYDRAIRIPMEALLAHAEDRWGPGRVMRPNRDVRFSADKSPYRLSASLWASSGAAGVYLQLSPAGLEVGGGLYEPSRDQLARGRAVIARGGRAPDALRSAVDALTASGFEVAGPSLSTAPKGYPRDHPAIELLRLRHYAAVRRLPVSATLAEVDAAWEAVEPLSAWVDAHVGQAESWP
ncbi:DUF2461 domain-containing protein [uncultured Amnibacterium sp.]|uniref:DUF2461 domain-containing protein n=1 Tax=uncultured Amnibacterium sp. TaxID=1631851 RepID=UPI0035CBA1F6